MAQNVSRNPTRDTTNISESKIVGNKAAPAVGAKFDHKQSSVISRRSSASRQNGIGVGGCC